VTPWDDDKLHEECGVFGVYGAEAGDASALVALGLHALQHRGQEAAGICSFDAEIPQFFTERRIGLVRDTFTSKKALERLPGKNAIGHNRYSTAGGKGMTALRDVQPIFAEFAPGGCAIAHNGNITNAAALKRDLVQRGSIFQSSSDTECIVHLMARSMQRGIMDRMKEALRAVQGAFSIVAMTRTKMIGVRDPRGVRPLVLGKFGEAHVLASETCALDIIGADYVRDIEPGEMVMISENGVESFRPFEEKPSRFCIFEYVYFSRPDSRQGGLSVYDTRHDIGVELAREAPVEADVVVPVPDSGTPAAIGFSQESGIPFAFGVIRNQYTGRTFIEPTDHIRNLGVKLKLNVNRSIVQGKRVVLVDDSVVRGTTSIKIMQMVRDAGAKEVHFRIASPPTAWPCFYGVDTPQRSKLLASRMTVEEMRDHIGVDSLAFVSTDGLYRACGEPGRSDARPQFCDACFTGQYPVSPADAIETGALLRSEGQLGEAPLPQGTAKAQSALVK
jgi:amidophosphoribosyltransferase